MTQCTHVNPIKYKISIVTATYNSSCVIAKCLQSVANQTFIDYIEHIIIDGGSTDDTLDVISKFPHVRHVVSERDRGIYHAFNKGVNIASGELIYFLGSDDYLFDPDVMGKVANLCSPDVDFISGMVIMEDPDSGRRWVHIGRDVSVQGQTYKHPSHQSFFMKTSILKNVYGGFPECFKIHADSYIMLKALSELKGIITSEVIAIFSVSGMSNSDEHRAINQRESTLVYGLLGIESENDIHNVSATYVNNFQTMKALVRVLLGNEHVSKGDCLVYKIFGVADLSLIIFELLRKYEINFSGFVATHSEIQSVNGFSVISLDMLKGDEIIINAVEGAHAENVTELIKAKNKDVTVIGWKDFIKTLL
jgi:glycosyltransferase involved in cell wall biosynthesis